MFREWSFCGDERGPVLILWSAFKGKIVEVRVNGEGFRALTWSSKGTSCQTWDSPGQSLGAVNGGM